MRQLLTVLAAIVFLATGPVEALAAGKRVALVVGNAAYQNVSILRNTGNDARAVAEALKRLGFDVTLVQDASQHEFRRHVGAFAKKVDGAEIAAVFFSGHGIEVNQVNYLLPVDARLRDVKDVQFETIPLQLVIDATERATFLRMIILDAARDNPFLGHMNNSGTTRSVRRGLARVEAPANTIVAFSAKGGTVALDGKGDHSPYTLALLKHLETPGLDVGMMFRRIRDSVLLMTNGQQEPFLYGSLPGKAIYLKPAQ